MASQPTIWRRNREAIRARVAAKKAENDAYRQQFVDAAAADAEKAAQPVPKPQSAPPQPQAAKQQQNNQRR